jgi:hypothetical protein
MLRTGDPSQASHLFRRAALILAVLPGGALTVDASAAQRLVFTQVPIESGFDLPAGSRIVSYDPSRPKDGVTNLTREFSTAGRPDVSFDGQRILFVGRRTPDDALDAWEMNTDGSGPRRITDQAVDIREAIYLSTIYTIDDAEPADQIAFCRPDANGTRSLYTCRVDGTRVAQITFDPYGATDPCALSDGRLLFPGGPDSALLTVNTDGTDVFVFGAAHAPAVSRGMPCETDDGLVVFVESSKDGEDRGGALVAVSRTSSLGTRRVIDDGESGRYRSPAPAGAGKLIVSFRRPEMSSYGLYWFVLESGKRTGVFNPPRWHELAVPASSMNGSPAVCSTVSTHPSRTRRGRRPPTNSGSNGSTSTGRSPETAAVPTGRKPAPSPRSCWAPPRWRPTARFTLAFPSARHCVWRRSVPTARCSGPCAAGSG